MDARDYQQWAKSSIFEFLENKEGNPCIALPTGTGKGFIIADFIKDCFNYWPDIRILMATHVKELIQQNYEKLLEVWPSAPISIYSAGLHQKDAQMPIVFGGVQSLVNDIESIGFRNLIIVDEAHLISPKENTNYQLLYNGLHEINPNIKIIGLTATPYRLGQGMVIDSGLLTDMCFDMTDLENFSYFINEGYLVNLFPYSKCSKYDVSNVEIQNGDYNQKQLQKTVADDKLTFKILNEIIDTTCNRNCWMIFTSGIDHCEHINEALISLGVDSMCVHSKSGNKKRDDNIAAFKAGEFKCAVSNGVLTTGFDHKYVDMIADLQPTVSPGKWVQKLGRGTRAVYAEGFDLSTREGRLAAIANSCKPNCLVLDFAGNTARLGPINDPVKPRKKGEKPGEAPVKICPECGIYNHISARNCLACGYEFPRYSKLHKQASTMELIKSVNPQIENFDVKYVFYKKHEKKNSIPSLQISYVCGMHRFVEYIHLEHVGIARRKAVEWWYKRLPNELPPNTIDEALLIHSKLKVPKRIKVWINKNYPEIMDHEF